jgi:PadR family transcriptional regulator, regulatory protein PadR
MRGARCRRPGPRGWVVRARVERFSEPALLLLLRERPAHGYELLDALPELLPAERVDMGNLYRALRSLEQDGLVSSEWDGAKRIYDLTHEGRALLDEWAAALARAQERISVFLTRYGKEVTDAPSSPS